MSHMMRLLRIALLAVIGLMLIGTVVMGVGSAGTGWLEKVVLLGFGAVLVFAATKVQGLGRDT